MKIRIKFKKYGAVRFIGHLDVMRFFQKALRRANIDVAYTAGFSPHQIMSFASPLGVGLESNGEYMDIEVNSLESCRNIVERLNAASVPGIEAVSAAALPEGAGNAMASVAAASYTVRFRAGRELGFDLEAAIKKLLEQEQIPILKETKKGSREADLKPGIYSLEWRNGALCMLLDASSAGNIKPAQVVEALSRLGGEPLQENAFLITREETFMRREENGQLLLVPLEAAGEVLA